MERPKPAGGAGEHPHPVYQRVAPVERSESQGFCSFAEEKLHAGDGPCYWNPGRCLHGQRILRSQHSLTCGEIVSTEQLLLLYYLTVA